MQLLNKITLSKGLHCIYLSTVIPSHYHFIYIVLSPPISLRILVNSISLWSRVIFIFGKHSNDKQTYYKMSNPEITWANTLEFNQSVRLSLYVQGSWRSFHYVMTRNDWSFAFSSGDLAAACPADKLQEFNSVYLYWTRVRRGVSEGRLGKYLFRINRLLIDTYTERETLDDALRWMAALATSSPSSPLGRMTNWVVDR